MIVIGLTGGIGAGKSTVAAMLKRLGAVVLDADAIARQVMEPKRLAWRQILKTFGEGILNEDQTIDRRRLARRVFSDESSRRRLEAIVHPLVKREMARAIGRLRGSRRVKAAVLDVPLLLEVGGWRGVDALVVVSAPPQVRRERLKRERGWSDEEISARMAAQWDPSAKVALADYVVENGGSVDATRKQVKRIWNQLGLRNSSRSSSTSQR